MDGIETLPYDEERVIYGIACQTCGTTMSLHRGRFPICDDCKKYLHERKLSHKSNWIADSKGGEQNHN